MEQGAFALYSSVMAGVSGWLVLGRGGGVSGDVLLALAQWAGQTVAAAAVTDAWEAVRGRFARLLGRGDARKAEVAERWLAQTRDQLARGGARRGPGADAGGAGGAVGWPVRGPAR